MKIKIKSFNGELPSYLSVNNEYEIEHIDKDGSYHIYIRSIDDYACIKMENCKHLSGGSWEVVNE